MRHYFQRIIFLMLGVFILQTFDILPARNAANPRPAVEGLCVDARMPGEPSVLSAIIRKSK